MFTLKFTLKNGLTIQQNMGLAIYFLMVQQEFILMIQPK